MTELQREVVEFLEEMANWNVPYQQRKVKGMMARQEAAQRLLADFHYGEQRISSEGER